MTGTTWNEARVLERAKARAENRLPDIYHCDNCNADSSPYPVRVDRYIAEVCRECWSAMREAADE